MSGIFIFLAIAFFVLRGLVADKAKQAVKSTKPYKDIQNALGMKSDVGKAREQYEQYAQKERILNRRAQALQLKNNLQFGHSNARKQAHDTLHSGDASAVFPKEHMAHVRSRDARDLKERLKMENSIHNKKNRGITKVGNKSMDGWGAKGGGAGAVNLNLILFGPILLFIVYSVLQ